MLFPTAQPRQMQAIIYFTALQNSRPSHGNNFS